MFNNVSDINQLIYYGNDLYGIVDENNLPNQPTLDTTRSRSYSQIEMLNNTSDHLRRDNNEATVLSIMHQNTEQY